MYICVSTLITMCMTDFVWSFQNCVTQIFDTREVGITQNATLAEEFGTNVKLYFQTIDQKIGKLVTVYHKVCIHGVECLH